MKAKMQNTRASNHGQLPVGDVSLYTRISTHASRVSELNRRYKQTAIFAVRRGFHEVPQV